MKADLPNMSWSEIVSDPGKYADEFRTREVEMRREAYKYAKLRKYAENLQDKQEELRLWQEQGIPEPASRQSKKRPQEDAGDAGISRERGNRRTQVLNLLSKHPDRKWKVNDIGHALDISDTASLRSSLHQFCRDGSLLKNDHAEYTCGPKAEEYLN